MGKRVGLTWITDKGGRVSWIMDKGGGFNVDNGQGGADQLG